MEMSTYLSLAIPALAGFGGYSAYAIHKAKGFLRPSGHTLVSEKCPLLGVLPSGTTLTRGQQLARVVEIKGRDFTGLDEDAIRNLFLARQALFESIPDGITVLVQTHRMLHQLQLKTGEFNNHIAKEISEAWVKNFRETFRTRHFFIFVTDTRGLLGASEILKQDAADGPSKEMREDLDTAVDDAIVRLQGYGAQELTGDALASYWATLLNGEFVHQKMPKSGTFDDLLTGTRLQFPKGKDYQIYDGARHMLSTSLRIKLPQLTSSNELLEQLCAAPCRLSIFQSFARYDKAKSLALLEDRIRNLKGFVRHSDDQQADLQYALEMVQSNRAQLLAQTFWIEVFGADEKELRENLQTVRGIAEHAGYRVAQEKVAIEGCYWARFPESHTMNPRKRVITSENAAHFALMPSMGEGRDRCSWGNAPVSVFKTLAGSDYSFIFHESEADEALGNTIVIGGSGSGKTTLMTFLLSQALKYPNFKCLNFDRLNGMRIWTKMLDGDYLEAANFEEMPLNPLLLEESSENRTFLSNFFQMIFKAKSQQEIDDINDAVGMIFDLPKSERTFESVNVAFGIDSMHKSFSQWLPGGAYGGYFNGKTDALDFSNPVVTIDMASLLSAPDVLGPITYHIFHKLLLQSRSEGGYAVFVDEFGKYLANPYFSQHIVILLEEIRKLDGCLIGAMQNAETFLQHEEIAPKVLNNVSTYILFPTPNAKKESYIDHLGLNEKEFMWIKRPHKHQVMVKRSCGESVILDVNLSALGKWLNVFQSGDKAQHKFQKAYGDGTNENWKELYLSS